MHRRSALYAWMAANAISFTGNRLTNLAIPWFVLETTGSVAQAGVTGFFSLLPIVLAAWLVAAMPQLAVAQLPPLPFMIGLAVLMGLGSGPLNPIIFTVMQQRVPLDMRARVFGMTRSLAWMAMPLGPMIGGYAAEAIGLRGAFTIIAVTYLMVAIAQFFIREMRGMDAPPKPVVPAVQA